MNARLAALTSTTLAALGITRAAESEPAAPVVVEGEIVEEPAGDPAPDEAAEAEAAAAAEAEAAQADADVAAAITLAATQSAAKATAEANARWAGVLGSDEAKGRTALAVTLLSTNLDAAAIKVALAASAKEAEGGFAARMADVKNPEVTAGGSDAAQNADNHGWGKARAKNSRTTAAK